MFWPSYYSNDSRKTEDESQVEKIQVGQLVSGAKSGKIDLSECTKLSVDESLVAPDPDMFGYRTFVVIKALGHGEKRLASRKVL